MRTNQSSVRPLLTVRQLYLVLVLSVAAIALLGYLLRDLPVSNPTICWMVFSSLAAMVVIPLVMGLFFRRLIIQNTRRDAFNAKNDLAIAYLVGRLAPFLRVSWESLKKSDDKLGEFPEEAIKALEAYAQANVAKAPHIWRLMSPQAAIDESYEDDDCADELLEGQHQMKAQLAEQTEVLKAILVAVKKP